MFTPYSLIRRALVAFVAVGSLVALPACDSDDPEEPMGRPAPNFAIASRVVTLADNSQGLQFFVTPNADVTLTRLEIRNPLGEGGAVPVQNLNLLAGVSQALQDTDEGYFRVSGTWTFRFGGNRTDGDREVFDVTTSLDVSAFAPDEPTETR